MELKNLSFPFIVALFSVFISYADAESPIPPDLVGIWATEGSEFRGQAIMKGQAIYLDTDGIGASIGGDGRAVIGVRLVVTSYDPSSHMLAIELTEHGKVMAKGTMTYDRIKKEIVDAGRRYHRRFDAVTPELRKSIGLEK
jgi:hypothetical protein